IDTATVCFPTRDTGSIVFVGISDTTIIFVAILIFRCIGIGVAAQPELFDKLLSLFIGLELLESITLFFGDNVSNIIIHPTLISLGGIFRFMLFLFALLFTFLF